MVAPDGKVGKILEEDGDKMKHVKFSSSVAI